MAAQDPERQRPAGGSKGLFADYFGAYRDRVLYAFAVAGAVFYLPFIVNEFVEGRIGVGIGSVLVVSVLWVDALAVRLGRNPPVPLEAMILPIIPTLMLSILQQGVMPVLWCYPVAMLFFFLLPQRTANITTGIMLAIIGALTYKLDGGPWAIRLVATLLLMMVIGNVVIYVIRDQQDRLIELATRDALTGAFNRRHLGQTIAGPVERHQRNGAPSSVLALDLDHFKRVNDRHGHAGGDRVLRDFVDLIQARIRRIDVLFRMGGEEFLVLVPDAREAEAAKLAEDLRQRVVAAALLDREPVTVSIGVAEIADGDSGESWLKRADAALYRAKQDGRDRVVRWSAMVAAATPTPEEGRPRSAAAG